MCMIPAAHFSEVNVVFVSKDANGGMRFVSRDGVVAAIAFPFEHAISIPLIKKPRQRLVVVAG